MRAKDFLDFNGGGKVSAQVLLDLSGALDTIGNEILLTRLDTDIEINANALSLFRSQLTGPT